MGIGAEISAAAAYIGEISPSRLRGRAGGLAAAWGYVGFAVVPFVSMALVPAFSWGWRVLFLIGAVGGLVVLPLRLHLPSSPRWPVAVGRVDDAVQIVTAAETRAREKPSRLRVTQVPIDRPPPVRKSHDFAVFAVLFVAVWFAYDIGNYGRLTLAPTLLTDQGFSLTTSIAFLSATGIGFVVGAFTAVGVAERIERKISIIAGLVVWAAALTTIGLIPSGGVIMALGFVASATIGFAVPIMCVYTGEHFHPARRARGVSIADGTGHIGGAIAPVPVMFGRRLNGTPAD
ncbi:MAG: MFS transporter [Actinobacteria bacterium]|nr:MFS transporter [Actinomycetota bacterium]